MSKQPLEILSESMFYVLMALLRGEKCGKEIADFVNQKTRGRVTLGPGTLYAILSRFEEEGFIEESAIEGRKRTYRLCKKGIKLYLKEKSRLYQMLDDAESEEQL